MQQHRLSLWLPMLCMLHAGGKRRPGPSIATRLVHPPKITDDPYHAAAPPVVPDSHFRTGVCAHSALTQRPVSHGLHIRALPIQN